MKATQATLSQLKTWILQELKETSLYGIQTIEVCRTIAARNQLS